MQKRKDSLSGQLRLIGRVRNWRKNSFSGLGFLSRQYGLGVSKLYRHGTRPRAAHKRFISEEEDIELIGQIVKEQVEFNWDKYESCVRKEKLEKLEQEEKQENGEKKGDNGDFDEAKASPNTVNRGGSYPEGHVVRERVGAVENGEKVGDDGDDDADSLVVVPVDVRDDADADDTDADGVVSSDDDNSIKEYPVVEKSLEEEVVAKISGEGKEKLRFIMEFATATKSLQKSKSLNDINGAEAPKLGATMKKNQLSNQKQTLPRNNTEYDVLFNDTMSVVSAASSAGKDSLKKKLRKQQKNNSIFSQFSQFSPNRNSSIIQNQAQSIDQKKPTAEELETKIRALKDSWDGFARYKGFENAEHMQRHLERIRGFEELKVETQIDIMARESGYRPSREFRNKSILSNLEEDYNAYQEKLKGLSSDSEGGNANEDDIDNEGLGGSGVDSDDEEENAGVSESDDEGIEYEKEMEAFRKFEGDDIVLLAESWDKVKGFNYEMTPEEKAKEKIREEQKLKEKEQKEKEKLEKQLEHEKDARSSRDKRSSWRRRNSLNVSARAKDEPKTKDQEVAMHPKIKIKGKDALDKGSKAKSGGSNWLEVVKKKQEEEEDARLFQKRRRVYDSLTMEHLKNIKFK